jgi:hypothetical protein
VKDTLLEKITAQKPRTVNNNYMIPLDRKPFYIQFPQCKIRSITKQSKKANLEFLFPAFEKDDVITFFKKIDEHCRNIILSHSEWFETELDENDVYTFFVPSCKEKTTSCVISAVIQNTVSIFNETATEKLKIDDLSEDLEVLVILEIIGIKCLSKKFQVEIETKQIMIIPSQINLFDTCVITTQESSAIHKLIPAPVLSLPPPHTTEENSDGRNERQRVTEKVEAFVVPEPVVVAEPPPPLGDQLEAAEEVILDITQHENPVVIKSRSDIHYEQYLEAKKRAESATEFARMAALEVEEKRRYLENLET